jgi:hypothetical protein
MRGQLLFGATFAPDKKPSAKMLRSRLAFGGWAMDVIYWILAVTLAMAAAVALVRREAAQLHRSAVRRLIEHGKLPSWVEAVGS